MRKKYIIIGIVAVPFLLLFLWLGFPYYTARTVEVTVTDKERIQDGAGSFYLVYTHDEVFQNIDSNRWLKHDSSDVQGRLVHGNRYRLRVYGWRIPWFSRYRNIVSVRETVSPRIVSAESAEELRTMVAEVERTRLPISLLLPQVADHQALSEQLRSALPSGSELKVFGDEDADLWGITVYWNPDASAVVVEAAPLSPGLPFWGPARPR